MDENYIKNYNRWFNTKSVLYLIAPYCYNREISIMALRKRDGVEFHKKSIIIANVNYLNDFFNGRTAGLDAYVLSFLYSLQSYDFSEFFKGKISDENKRRFFEENKPISHNLCFDMDGEGKTDVEKITNAYKDTLKFTKELVNKGYKVHVVFSGGKGFHIETGIQSTDFDDWKHTALKLGSNHNIDKAVYSARREWRCPYTLHSKTNRVLLPLTENQFLSFSDDLASNLDSLNPLSILNNENILGERVKLFNRVVLPYEF